MLIFWKQTEMTRETARRHIIEVGIIPSIRTSSADEARFAAETVTHAGIPIVEITMTVPGALEVITELARTMPDLIVGAGTIFDLKTARQCVDAGARFLTSPGLNLQIVEFALKEGILAMPGALTPTEVTAAWQAGADFIKVFPCAQLGGASYIHALKAPFPEVPLVAAGGVNQQTAAEFIVAGAAAIGVGTELIPKKAVEQRNQHWITELTRRFLSILQEARSRTAARDEAVDRR
jgi:2-dehydro-3-deoxyphosphogluconate aldolase/(4S)-4-hydroxy-2-oxoglutarate aldolase